MKHYHPQKNDKGQPVEIISPSQPSGLESWLNPGCAATVTPGAPMPDSITEIDIRSWTESPTDSADWESLVKDCRFDEPPFKPNGKAPASGAVVIETDGRVWIVSPSNGFGGYTHTAPKGKLDPKEALSLRANALKEVYEETGLHVELIGFLCDATRTTSTTRYYLARRLGGNPADMGWESQSVHLVPRSMLSNFLTTDNDKTLLEALSRTERRPTRAELLKSHTLSSGCRIVFTVNGFRKKYGKWPTRVLIDSGMFEALPVHVLTPLGWAMLATKLELVSADNGTVIAEGGDGTSFNYDDYDHSLPGDGIRADEWIWGVKLAD